MSSPPLYPTLPNSLCDIEYRVFTYGMEQKQRFEISFRIQLAKLPVTHCTFESCPTCPISDLHSIWAARISLTHIEMMCACPTTILPISLRPPKFKRIATANMPFGPTRKSSCFRCPKVAMCISKWSTIISVLRPMKAGRIKRKYTRPRDDSAGNSRK